MCIFPEFAVSVLSPHMAGTLYGDSWSQLTKNIFLELNRIKIIYIIIQSSFLCPEIVLLYHP